MNSWTTGSFDMDSSPRDDPSPDGAAAERPSVRVVDPDAKQQTAHIEE